MISQIHIERYKSIKDLPLELGRVNVFIGENGAGKSNILEAIALAGAAAAEKLDNEFLASRGIRVTVPENMRPAFKGSDPSCLISVSVKAENNTFVVYEMQNDNAPYSKWTRFGKPSVELDVSRMAEVIKKIVSAKEPEKRAQAKIFFDTVSKALNDSEKESKNNPKSRKKGNEKFYTLTLNGPNEFVSELLSAKPAENARVENDLRNFVIYSPENTALRTLQPEGQIEPLGVNGEGIFKMFSLYSRLATTESTDPSEQKQANQAKEILLSLKTSLRVLGWFEDVKLGRDLEDKLEIKDLHLGQDARYLEHSSANEGFLFLLFYFLLFTSDLTPRFFAIDNIDASLNPRLCQKLMSELTRLAKLHGKQVILTTHNPAILDGLNLNDDEQRLFIVSRASSGETKAKRFLKKNAKDGITPPKLSELFLRGIIGGLPKGF